MATDAIITLERLRCIRESDGTGHSEPYIWPALLWIDNNTLATPELVGVTDPAIGNARVVIKSDMRAGETADIPSSVRVLRVRFEDGLSIRRLILAVVLWEEDETPEAAMRAGFQAFSSELRAAIADNLVALNQANEEEEKAIIATIKTRIRDQVRSAIKNGLTASEKARVALGTLNLDDIINSDFKNIPDLRATPITLTFRAGEAADDYEIQGNLQVLPVVVDLCQAQVNVVKAAQSAVDAIDARIRQLEDELQHASTAEKPFIISEIRRLGEERHVAMAAFEDARRVLQTCRESTTIHPVLELNGRWTDGSNRSAVISAAFTSLTVDMSAFNRPAANGSIVDASTITVTFPDDATYTGQLLPPNTIRWSNGSAWTKVL